LHLMQIGSVDCFNTLRISNIVYSLTMFLLLLKIGPLENLQNYLKPRHTTFGIYLIHQIWIFRLLPEIFRPFNIKVEEMTVYGAVVYTILRFIIVYGLTFLVVKLLLRTRFKWIIGIGKTSSRVKDKLLIS
jgi:large-conductance mechanosensitive channel